MNAQHLLFFGAASLWLLSRRKNSTGHIHVIGDAVSVKAKANEADNTFSVNASGVIDAPLEDVVDLLWNIDKWPNVIPTVSKVKNLSKTGSSRIDYMLFDLGLLAGSQDVVSESKLKEDDDKAIISFKNRDDVGPAETRGINRLQERRGSWTLVADGEQTKVTYQMTSNPGPKAQAFKDKVVSGMLKGVKDLFSAIEKNA